MDNIDVEIIKDDIGLKVMTKAQKKKAQRVIDLISQLKNDGINTVIIASPDNSIAFYRSEKWADSMEDLQTIDNNLFGDNEYIFRGDQECSLIDAVAY